MEITFHLRLEQMKLDLEKIKDYKLSSIFKMLDLAKKKYIDLKGLRRFLYRMGHQTLPQEL
jgi:Ca2+-binding EF-hand superfamily protein